MEKLHSQYLSFEQFAAPAPSDAVSPAAVAASYTTAHALMQQIRPYEYAISTTPSVPSQQHDHLIPHWQQYLAFVIAALGKQSQKAGESGAAVALPSLVVSLYGRYVCCYAHSPHAWVLYLSYLYSVLPQLCAGSGSVDVDEERNRRSKREWILTQFERAVRNCVWSGSLLSLNLCIVVSKVAIRI